MGFCVKKPKEVLRVLLFDEKVLGKSVMFGWCRTILYV